MREAKEAPTSSRLNDKFSLLLLPETLAGSTGDAWGTLTAYERAAPWAYHWAALMEPWRERRSVGPTEIARAVWMAIQRAETTDASTGAAKAVSVSVSVCGREIRIYGDYVMGQTKTQK